MINDETLSLYPTLASKVWRRLCDTPWRLADARDAIFPGEFTKYYRIISSYTMSSSARLRGLYQAVQYVVRHNIEGDVVECGTARNGSAALMGSTLNQLRSNRMLWVFDTFEGLPPPSSTDPDYESAQYHTGECRGKLPEVENLFKQCGISEHSRLIKGLFQETLPISSVKKIRPLAN